MALFKKLTPEEIAKKLEKQLQDFEKKYNCRIGVWVTPLVLVENLKMVIAQDIKGELFFNPQIKFIVDGEEPADTNTDSRESGT